MPNYLFRKGDGNEGNYPLYVVELTPEQCPYAALRALVSNEYKAGLFREHIDETIVIDGEAEYGISAMVFEGPNEETAFGAAWLMAELQPIDETCAKRYERYDLFEVLDDQAKALYTLHAEE